MPMSFGGHAASSSGCVIGPKARETGLPGSVGRTRSSLRTGCYAMATAEHREPCESRGSCTVLGAPGGEIPPGDSTGTVLQQRSLAGPLYHHIAVAVPAVPKMPPCARGGHAAVFLALAGR